MHSGNLRAVMVTATVAILQGFQVPILFQHTEAKDSHTSNTKISTLPNDTVPAPSLCFRRALTTKTRLAHRESYILNIVNCLWHQVGCYVTCGSTKKLHCSTQRQCPQKVGQIPSDSVFLHAVTMPSFQCTCGGLLHELQ